MSGRTTPNGRRPSGRCDCARCRAHDGGHSGPFTPQEFVELFGVVAQGPVLEVPEELAALGIEVDVAAESYELAVGRLQAAVTAEANASSSRGGQNLLSAAAEVSAARSALDEEADRLSAARVAYNDLAERLSRARTAAAYAADQQAQAVARTANRARQGTPRRSGRLTRRSA